MIKRINAPADKNIYCRELFLYGIKKDGTKGSRSSKLPKKYHYFLDAPFKISDDCCKILKKKPLKKYEKNTGLVPITGVMAVESDTRAVSYLKTGCNSFNNKEPMSKPMGFWTEQDVLAYIKMFNLNIASVYGDVVCDDNVYRTTGEQRTGCIYCLFGCQHDKGENRFQRLQRTHPILHKYCMDNLGIRNVLEYMNIPCEVCNDVLK